MSSLKLLNPKSEVAAKGQALLINVNAGKGLQEVLRSNLGPRGTIKMLVSGGGEIKLTKDGNVLLHEMQIQHPTAALIARSATAQDDATGDGTTTNVLLIGELLKQSERALAEGIHPRVLTEGFDLARARVDSFLESFKVSKDTLDRELLIQVARSSLRTKLTTELADKLTDIVVDALLTIHRAGKPIDLFMVEIMTMVHRTSSEMRLVKGLVLDHGARHPDMPKKCNKAFILTCNVSLEYEKSEVNAETKYADVATRNRLVDAERRVVDEKVRKVIELKRKVCSGDKADHTFVVINQKGIDALSLDMLAKEGILGLRRAKRRNMERLTLACGGVPVNSVDDLEPEVLGFAETVYEQTLGEEKYTFVEGVENPQSVTILLKAGSTHQINQLKDAVRDGLRAVKNAIEDKFLVPGAGAFEVGAAVDLRKYVDEAGTSLGKARWGVLAFADALLVVPKTLAENAGLDAQDSLLELSEAHRAGHVVGIDLETGEPLDPQASGIWDLYRVKRQLLRSATVVAQQLLLIDEILKAGKAGGGGGPAGAGMPGMPGGLPGM